VKQKFDCRDWILSSLKKNKMLWLTACEVTLAMECFILQ
jgi:hypothetical protein